MTTSSSKDQCELVVDQLKKLLSKEMYFRSAGVAKDDAGLHVEVRIKRPDLMGKDPPHIGCIDGVRICVVILG